MAILYKLSFDMVIHLKPLYVKAIINRRPFSCAFVDNRVLLNVMPYSIVKKLRRSRKNFSRPICK